MRDETLVVILFRQYDRIQRLGQCSDLIEFDQNRVGDTSVDAAPQDRRV